MIAELVMTYAQVEPGVVATRIEHQCATVGILRFGIGTALTQSLALEDPGIDALGVGLEQRRERRVGGVPVFRGDMLAHPREIIARLRRLGGGGPAPGEDLREQRTQHQPRTLGSAAFDPPEIISISPWRERTTQACHCTAGWRAAASSKAARHHCGG